MQRFCLFAAAWLLTLLALPPAPPTLLITEIYYNAVGEDAAEEWIEITNFSTEPIALDDFKLGDEETAGGPEGMLRFPIGSTIGAAETIIIAQTAVNFRARYGFNPTFEITESDAAIANMRPFPLLASGSVGLANDGDEVILRDAGNKLVDAVSYGESRAFFLPTVATVARGSSLARVPASCDSDTAADWRPQPLPAPGRIDTEGDCAVPMPPEATANVLPIGAVQGAADSSPVLNQTVSVRGGVTGVHTDRNASGVLYHTFYLQDEGDDDSATSDGVAVFLGRRPPDVNLGDVVLVTGQITEFFGLTEFEDEGLVVQGVGATAALPTPIPLTAIPTEGEALEGMLVTVADAVVVGPSYEIPSGCGFAVMAQNGPRPIKHSTSDETAAIIQILHHDESACAAMAQFNVGDKIAGITGPLTYNFGAYKIINQAALTLTAAADQAVVPPPVATSAQFSVATVNLENYFDVVDTTGSKGEPKPTAAEIAIKRRKLALMVAEALGCPTLVAVQEAENEKLLLELAAEAAPLCGFTYAVSHRESFDERGIDTALLSHPTQVAVLDARLQQTCTTLKTGISGYDCPAGHDPLFSRPPLQVVVALDGENITLFVNHFKSKRGGEAETERERLAQAAFVAELAAAAEGEVIVLGDFNDYADSPTLQRLAQSGLENLLRRLPAAEQYSFVFAGAAQLIDGVLVSEGLAARVAAVHIAHVNADFAAAHAQVADSVWRAADHDPPLVVFEHRLPEKGEATTAATIVPTHSSTLTPSPTAQAAPTETSSWRLLFFALGGGAILLMGAAVFWRSRT